MTRWSFESTTAKSVAYLIRFEGANLVKPIGKDRLAFNDNFFIGNERGNWKTDVPNYREVIYENLYDGIDLVYGVKEGRLKYEFHVRPDANPMQIELAYEGVNRLRLDPGGALIASTAVGDVGDLAPVANQGDDEIRCPFALRGPASFGFACQGWDTSRALVIDPLLYATFLGGNSVDIPWDVAADASGNAYVAGFTMSPNFPVTPGAFDTSLNSMDGFVAKLNPDGKSLAWATYLGGSGGEWANGITVDALGDVYVVGDTRSDNFPVTAGAFDTSFNGMQDAFVARFIGNGALAWATYLGGSESEEAHVVALDTSGNVVVASSTYSPDFPVTPGAFDVSFAGDHDGYVAKLDPSGRVLLWATFLGGVGSEDLSSITLDSDDSIYVAGITNSTDFPTTPGAFDRTLDGPRDAFVAKLDSAGSTLVWSTYLGGSNTDGGGGPIVLDGSGNLYVSGGGNSTNFPVTPGAFDKTLDGPWDVFVTKLNSTVGDLVWATFLGGSDSESGGSLALDAAGNVCVVGETQSTDFPATPDAFDTTLSGTADAFLAKLSPSGSSLLYATFLGGSGFDDGRGLVIDASGNEYIIGSTDSSDFPVTSGAFQTVYRGGGDAFVVKMGPIIPVNTPPVLSWTGEANYVSDGLDPEMGTTITDFAYRVAYSDADNQTPAQIKVRIDTPLGAPWGTFSMAFARWVGPPNNYTVGAIYAFNTTLPVGTDWWYAFQATDGWAPATGSPTVPVDAPDVVADNPPNAVARASPTVAHMGDMITFDATSSTDDNGIVAYRWDFGDGANDSNSVTTHAYASRGTFLATVTVWDAVSQNDTDNVSVSVENRPPIANAGPDQTVSKKTQVTLDGTGSSDPDLDFLTYAWLQTGGSNVALLGANTPAPMFTPPTSGIYTFQMTVDDGNSGVAADTVVVTATNTPPLAEAGPDRTALKNTLVALDGSHSSDSDGDMLTFTWAQVSGPAVTLSNEGIDTPTFTPARVGTYAFRLTVDDGDGGTSEDTVPVTVWGLPPIADLVARPPSAQVGAQIEFDASGSADPDGTIVDFAFLFGDHASTSGSTAVRNHSYAAPGSYVVTLTVTDDDGNVSIASVTVEVTSPPPSVETNYKPLVAVIFAVILLVAGLWSSKRRPWKGGRDKMAVMKAFAITSLPFVILEAATGIVSFLTGLLSIPPFIGVGTAVDLGILLAGVATLVSRGMKSGTPETE